MQIKKFILFIIVTVVLIVSSLPISFAIDQPLSFTTSLTEPELSYSDNGTYIDFSYYITFYNSSSDLYNMFVLHGRFNSGTTLEYRAVDYNYTYIIGSTNAVSGTYELYDLETGNLTASGNSLVRGTTLCITGSRSGFPAGTTIAQYTALPEQIVRSSQYKYHCVEPFVTFGTETPEHNQYHSSLSEPIADQYNSYAVINNGLYWLSYKVNALYSYDQNIEVESSVYSGSGDIDTSGTGTYAGQNNGITEPVSLSGEWTGGNLEGNVAHRYDGIFTSDSTGNIDYSGVENGSVHLNSNGTYTYNDLEVYPVSFNSQLVSSMFSVVLVVEDQKNFKMRIIPNNSQLSGMICDIDLYASSFMLETGEYVGSFANNYTGVVNYCGAEYSLSGDQIIHDVRMYGCEFYNPNNIPCHLASVLWQYDIDFAEWRSRMEQQLIAIYSALRGEDVETETYTQPSWDIDLSQAEPATRISNDEMQSVFTAGLDDVRPSPEAQLSITGWVNMFAIPKLIAACCFALAMGTIILTLGKKKSD